MLTTCLQCLPRGGKKTSGSSGTPSFKLSLACNNLLYKLIFTLNFILNIKIALATAFPVISYDKYTVFNDIYLVF